MSESSIEPDSLNSNIFSIQVVTDEEGNNRIINNDIMSPDFDGGVPVESETIEVTDLRPGMSFLIPETQTLVPVLSINSDDPEVIENPSTDYVISYLSQSGDIQEIRLSPSDEVEAFYENSNEIIFGETGWAITQGGNAVFNNITARGKIEALSGDIGGWEITPQGEFEDGGVFYDGSVPAEESGSGVYITGIYTGFGIHTDDWEEESDVHQPSKIFMVYAPGLDPAEPENLIPAWNDPKTTFYVDGHGYFSLGDKLTFNANTGDLTIGGYASQEDLEGVEDSLDGVITDINDRISASISDLIIDAESLSASIDFLYNAGFVTDDDLVTTGGTIINGNNITTGVINTNLMNVTTDLTPNRGIKMSALGLTAYNSNGQPTFNINSGTGVVTITGYPTEEDLDEYVEEGELYNPGTTTISGGKIRTGIIQSNSYDGVTDGTTFSTNGLAINLTTGALTAESFRIDQSGNAEFRGTITAGRGTFTGAAPGTVDGLIRYRYNPSGAWVTSEPPTVEITRNAGLNSTGYLSFYRPTSTAQNSAVGISFFTQGGSGDGDSSGEAIMRGAIELGSSANDGFESGNLLRILSMPSKSGSTPGKVKIQAAGNNTKIQLSATNIFLRNSKDDQYAPGDAVVNENDAALLGTRTATGKISIGPRISWSTVDANATISNRGWSTPRDGDLHFQY